MFHRNGITTVSVAMVFIAGLLGSAPPASAASIPAGPDGPTPFDPTQNVQISTPDGSTALDLGTQKYLGDCRVLKNCTLTTPQSRIHAGSWVAYSDLRQSDSLWNITPADGDDALLNLRAPNSSLCMSATARMDSDSETFAEMQPCRAAPEQQWALFPKAGGFEIRSGYGATCLTRVTWRALWKSDAPTLDIIDPKYTYLVLRPCTDSGADQVFMIDPPGTTGIAIAPDGASLIVTNEPQTRATQVALTSAGALQHPVAASDDIDTKAAGLSHLVVAPDGKSAYALETVSNRVAVIDLESRKVTRFIPVGSLPTGLAVVPDGTKLIVTSSDSFESKLITLEHPDPSRPGTTLPDQIDQIDTQSSWITDVALTADGKTAYLLDAAGSRVGVFDLATRKITSFITVGLSPRSLAVSPDGSHVFVANMNPTENRVITTRTLAVAAIDSSGAGFEQVAVAPDGSVAYFSDPTGNRVAIVDAGTLKVKSFISIPGRPTRLTVDSKTGRVFVAEETAGAIAVLAPPAPAATKGASKLASLVATQSAAPLTLVPGFSQDSLMQLAATSKLAGCVRANSFAECQVKVGKSERAQGPKVCVYAIHNNGVESLTWNGYVSVSTTQSKSTMTGETYKTFTDTGFEIGFPGKLGKALPKFAMLFQSSFEKSTQQTDSQSKTTTTSYAAPNASSHKFGWMQQVSNLRRYLDSDLVFDKGTANEWSLHMPEFTVQEFGDVTTMESGSAENPPATNPCWPPEKVRLYNGEFDLNFDANGAQGVAPEMLPFSSTDADAQRVVVPDHGQLVNPGKIFLGWNTAADGSGVDWPVGSEHSLTADVKLYAQWIDAAETGFSSVATNATGSRIVVANPLHPNSKLVVAGTPVARIDSKSGQFESAAMSTDGTTAYLVDGNAGAVVQVDTTTGSIKKTFAVGGHPVAVAVSPDGSRLYVTNTVATGAREVTIATGAIDPLAFGNAVFSDVAVSHDGSHLYLTDSADSSVGVYDLVAADAERKSSGTATGSQTAAPSTALTFVSVGENPSAIAVSSDDTSVYVTSSTTPNAKLIDLSGDAPVVRDLDTGGAFFRDVVCAPDGSAVYFTRIDQNQVARLDPTTNVVSELLNLPGAPTGLAMTGDGTRLLVSTALSNKLTTVTLNSSAAKVMTLGSPISLAANAVAAAVPAP